MALAGGGGETLEPLDVLGAQLDAVGRPRPLRPRRRVSTRSEDFRIRWAAHDVRIHRAAVKHVHHPVVGDLSLNFESLDLAADPGLTISTYTAEAGSRSDHALRLLGSRAATVDPAESSSATDRS